VAVGVTHRAAARIPGRRGAVLTPAGRSRVQPARQCQRAKDIVSVALTADEKHLYTADIADGASEEYTFPDGTLVKSFTVGPQPAMVLGVAVSPADVP